MTESCGHAVGVAQPQETSIRLKQGSCGHSDVVLCWREENGDVPALLVVWSSAQWEQVGELT